MDPVDHLIPFLLFLAGSALVLLGVLVFRKTRQPSRLLWLFLCLTPAIILVGIGWRLESRLLQDARTSRQLFVSLDPGPNLLVQEAEAFQVLATNSPRVREGVLRLAFASPTNAATALPRLEILLHCAVRLPAEKHNEPERLWTTVVQPALRKKPPREVVFLAAATAALGNYDATRVNVVLQELHPLLGSETNPVARATALGVFLPLVEFAPPDQVDSAANLLLTKVLEEQDPMRGTVVLASFKLERSRLLTDLRRAAARLRDTQARRFADQVLTKLASQTNQSRAQALGWALDAVKSSLSPEQMDRAVTNLIQQLPRNRGGELHERAGPLVGLAEVLPPRQAAGAVELLLGSLRQESDRWWHAELSRALKTLAPRLTDDDLLRLAEPMEAAAPDVVEIIRHRIPQEQVYLWMDRLLQGIIDTPNPTRRSAQIPRVAPLAVRLSPERAAKLVDELWHIFLRDADGSRRWDEAGCLVALVPHLADEQVVSQAKLIVERMQQPNSDLGTPVKLLIPFLGRCAPETAQEAVACVMKRSEELKPGFGSPRVQEREFLLGAPFTPAEKKILLEPLVAAFESHDRLDNYMGWVTGLKPVADLLAPDQAERVANRLVHLYTNRPTAMSVSLLNSLATNMTLTPFQSKLIADAILPRALEYHMPDSDTFARCSGLFLRQLDPADAEATGQTIIDAMARMRDPMAAVLDAKCFVPLAQALQPDQAARLAEQLLKIPAQRGNRPGLESLMDAASEPTLPADWMLPAVFLERQENGTYQHRLQAWSRSLAALMERMEKNEAQRIADQVAARCAEQGQTCSIAFEEQIALVLQHASEPTLARILRTPFGLGGLRRTALRAWELKTGQPPPASLSGIFNSSG
jgi:hypothetical protein